MPLNSSNGSKKRGVIMNPINRMNELLRCLLTTKNIEQLYVLNKQALDYIGVGYDVVELNRFFEKITY